MWKNLIYVFIIVLATVGVCQEGACDMQINNPLPPTIIQTTSGELIKIVKVPIGIWNMNDTNTVFVIHGLGTDWDKVIGATVWIRNDAGDVRSPIERMENAGDPNLLSGGITFMTAIDLCLSRRTGGKYQKTTYQSTAFSRGDIYFLVEL